MTNIFERFGTDSKLEEDGNWIDFGMGLRVKVRRNQSRPVRNAYNKFSKPYVGASRRGELPEDAAEEVLMKVMADSIIVNWEGVDDAKGKAIPYSYDAALKILEELPDFRDEIARASGERDLFQADLDKDSEKN